METIQNGTDDVVELATLSCCWPPGSMTMQYPDAE
jgi:hypothetical protein